MRSVLGIDAAWTATNPSGVALATEDAGVWRLRAIAPSYDQFISLAPHAGLSSSIAKGSVPSASALLATAEALTGRSVDLVAIDMPMALTPITGRRTADQAISTEYGGRSASTHSPSAVRPGALSDNLRHDFELSGYPLRTGAGTTTGLIEVYPHPALIELAESVLRLPYKLSKIAKYWPDNPRPHRLLRLLSEWKTILSLLDNVVTGSASFFPSIAPTTPTRQLKSYEDMLDAVICAWVGICVMDGRAVPFGDHLSCIWVPRLRP